MRRKDREVTSIEDIISIIDECKVLRIGVVDEEGMYIVPLNFGYEYINGTFSFYIHSAKEGRKVNALRDNPAAAVEMDCGHALVKGDRPERYTYRYRSVIGNGKAVLLTDPDEVKRGLSIFMKHQTGAGIDVSEEMARSVNVYKITVKNLTGKQNI